MLESKIPFTSLPKCNPVGNSNLWLLSPHIQLCVCVGGQGGLGGGVVGGDAIIQQDKLR